jgi:DNA-binding transcriptional MerR regulator
MKTLQQLARENPQWTLEAFVQVANDCLPQFLPNQEPNARLQEDINPRLVRYYSTQGLIDKPLKHGREVRYGYRHLLQLLLVKRLLMEGYTSTAITRLVLSKDNAAMESLLHGGVELTVQAANPALAFLEHIQQRASSPAPAAPAAMSRNPGSPAVKSIPAATGTASAWLRLEILPGLEIHVHENFNYPNSDQEQKNLLQIIAHRLFTLATQRRRSL